MREAEEAARVALARREGEEDRHRRMGEAKQSEGEEALRARLSKKARQRKSDAQRLSQLHSSLNMKLSPGMLSNLRGTGGPGGPGGASEGRGRGGGGGRGDGDGEGDNDGRSVEERELDRLRAEAEEEGGHLTHAIGSEAARQRELTRQKREKRMNRRNSVRNEASNRRFNGDAGINGEAGGNGGGDDGGNNGGDGGYESKRPDGGGGGGGEGGRISNGLLAVGGRVQTNGQNPESEARAWGTIIQTHPDGTFDIKLDPEEGGGTLSSIEVDHIATWPTAATRMDGDVMERHLRVGTLVQVKYVYITN